MIAYLKAVPKPIEDKIRSECQWVVDHVVIDRAVLSHLPPPVRTAAHRYPISQLIKTPLVFHSESVRVHLMHVGEVSCRYVGPYVLVSRSKLPQHHIGIVKSIHSSFHYLKHIPEKTDFENAIRLIRILPVIWLYMSQSDGGYHLPLAHTLVIVGGLDHPPTEGDLITIERELVQLTPAIQV